MSEKTLIQIINSEITEINKMLSHMVVNRSEYTDIQILILQEQCAILEWVLDRHRGEIISAK